MFEDIQDAMRRLFEELPLTKLTEDSWIIIALSAESFYIAEQIAKKTQNKLDVLFTEIVYAPNNPECEIAIVSESEDIIIHDQLVNSFGISVDFIYGEAKRKYEEKIIQHIYTYRRGLAMQNLNDKRILFVSESINTGLILQVAIKTAINLGAKSIAIATPLISHEAYDCIDPIVDDIFVVHKIQDFTFTKHYYKEQSCMLSSYIQTVLNKETK